MKKTVLLRSLALGCLLGATTVTVRAQAIVDGGTYKLTHHGVTDPATGQALCLDVDFDSNQPGASIGQYLDNGLDAQRFIFEKQTDGSYKLRHKNTQLYVQPVGLATAANTGIEQNVSSSSDAQRWIITNTGADGYKFTLKATASAALPQVLEIGFGSNVPGARVNLFDDNGFVPAQRWDLTLIANPLATRRASEAALQLEAYPNPAGPNQELKVRVQTARNGAAEVQVLDVLGQVVHTQQTSLRAGGNVVSIGGKALASGVYMVRLRQNDLFQQTRVVRQ